MVYKKYKKRKQTEAVFFPFMTLPTKMTLPEQFFFHVLAKSCFWMTSIALGQWRPAQQDTRKILFKPVVSFVLVFLKKEEIMNLATHTHTKHRDTVKSEKKKKKSQDHSWKNVQVMKNAVKVLEDNDT